MNTQDHKHVQDKHRRSWSDSQCFCWPTQNSAGSGLTFLLVEHQLRFELPPVVQRSLDLGRGAVAGFRAVQEVTGAALLHELGAGVTGELAEAVGAVDDGVQGLDLGVPQDKVTVCGGQTGERSEQQPGYTHWNTIDIGYQYVKLLIK